MKEFVVKQLARSLDALQKTLEDTNVSSALAEAGALTAKALRAGNKLLIAGNGGSAGDAQHMASEFVVRLTVHRPPLCAIALTTDTSILTAAGNDFNYESIFERQLEAIGQKGDVFLAISTSGNSNNMLKAVKMAHQKEILTIGLTGSNGGAMHDLCDINIAVPSRVTTNIQEVHLVLEHIFGMVVEQSYFGPSFGQR